jgi:hypothetical protein
MMHILLRNYPLYLCLLIIFMNEKVLHMKIHFFLLYFKVGYYTIARDTLGGLRSPCSTSSPRWERLPTRLLLADRGGRRH